ncbi:MAG TPA: hypothetical protein VIZ65_09415 [Cellvibrionaceae bacterium]
MSDIHIDDFYRDAARILVLLYNQFPRKTTLYIEDIAGPDEPDEFGLHSARHLACFYTMLWLGQNDYLQYESLIRQEAMDQTVLSHRAFMLLSSLPQNPHSLDQTLKQIPAAVAEQNYLLINRLRRELKEGSSYSLAELMQQLMLTSRQFS